MKPHWENMHDWAIGDIRFTLEQIWFFKKLLRKHFDDKMGDSFRDIIKTIKENQKQLLKEYEEIYGDKPDMLIMRREVESKKQGNHAI